MTLSGGAAGIMSVVMSTAVLPYQDPEKSAEWLCNAFGFSIYHVAKEPNGGIQYISLKLGRNFVLINPAGGPVFADLLVGPESVGKRATQTCYVNVADIEVHFAQAKLSGASIALEPETDSDGSSFYMCRDPEGHLWIFGTRQYAAEPELHSAAQSKDKEAEDQDEPGKLGEQKDKAEEKPFESLELKAIQPIELIAAEPEPPSRSRSKVVFAGFGTLFLLLCGVAVWSYLAGGIDRATDRVNVAVGGNAPPAPQANAPLVQQANALLAAERQRREEAEKALQQANAQLSTANGELVRLRGQVQESERQVRQSRVLSSAEQKTARAQKLTEIVLKQQLLEATQKFADLASENQQTLELQQTAQERIAKVESDLVTASRDLATLRQERDQLRQELASARNTPLQPSVGPSLAQRPPANREETVEELVNQLKSRERANAEPNNPAAAPGNGRVASFEYPPPRVLDTPASAPPGHGCSPPRKERWVGASGIPCDFAGARSSPRLRSSASSYCRAAEQARQTEPQTIQNSK